MAKYNADNKLRSVNGEQCTGISTVTLAFEDPKGNQQSEEFKSMIKQVKGSPAGSGYLLELIGVLSVDGKDHKFVVREIIKVSRANL